MVHLRSKVDVIQLAIVVKESLVKKYGYPIIYKQLIQDMCKLEEGIDVEFPFRRKVKIGFPLHLGDNLECHSVGGFRTCFSSGHICRFCKIVLTSAFLLNTTSLIKTRISCDTGRLPL